MPEQADTTTRPSLSHDLPTLAVSVEFNPDNYTLMDDGSELVPIWIIKTNLNGTIEIPEKFSASCTGGEKDRPSQFTMDFILNKMKLRAKFDTLTTNGDLNILHNTPVTGLTTLYGIITPDRGGATSGGAQNSVQAASNISGGHSEGSTAPIISRDGER